MVLGVDEQDGDTIDIVEEGGAADSANDDDNKPEMDEHDCERTQKMTLGISR